VTARGKARVVQTPAATETVRPYAKNVKNASPTETEEPRAFCTASVSTRRSSCAASRACAARTDSREVAARRTKKQTKRNENAREKEKRREKQKADTVFSFPAPRERYLVSADRCYCFLSYRPAFEWHFEVLRAVAAAERFERAREAAEAINALGDEDEKKANDEDDDDAFDSTGLDDVFDSMACLSESFAVVAAYETFDVSPALQRLGGAAGVSKEAVAQFGTFDAQRRDAKKKKTCTTTPPMTFPGEFFPADAFSVFEHSADRWRTATACRVLSLETLLTAATAALLERRMVVAHPNLGELSAIVFAVTSAMLKTVDASRAGGPDRAGHDVRPARGSRAVRAGRAV
jgi:hypothetical protein